MAARWRTWDLECLDLTLRGQNENEVEPLIAAVAKKPIPFVDLSSIALPKDTFCLSSVDVGVRTRGRGWSLANRALGFDKPSRRPGERDRSDMVGISRSYNLYRSICSRSELKFAGASKQSNGQINIREIMQIASNTA